MSPEKEIASQMQLALLDDPLGSRTPNGDLYLSMVTCSRFKSSRICVTRDAL